MIFWRIGLPENTPVASVQITPAQARQQPVTLNDFTLFGVSPEKKSRGRVGCVANEQSSPFYAESFADRCDGG
ncbi:hypothetical protein DZS_44670 [Dickeya ananatis]